MAVMTDTKEQNTATDSSQQDNPAGIASLAMITLDAKDAGELATFYAGVLGWPIVHQDEYYAMLAGPSHALGIGVVPDHQPPSWPDDGHKQFHLDLAVADIEAAAAACVDLGATRPAEQPGESWLVLLDPAGHPFCLTDAANWG